MLTFRPRNRRRRVAGVPTLVVALLCLGPTLAACTTASPGTTEASDPRLPAPPGYSNQQLIFDDQFLGTSLDQTKWSPVLGADGVTWNNYDSLPSPYSGPNTPVGEEVAMFGPSQVRVDNGLTLTAQRNTNQWAGAYPWISGVVTTEGKFSLPTSGWYVQVKAKMPDTSQGMWPAIWFLRGPSGSPNNELDLQEGGQEDFLDPNLEMHSDYFSDQGQEHQAVDTGVDLSGGYHIYGVEFIPGRSITGYFDGRQVWQIPASSGTTITGEPYEIILQLEVASQQASGGHTTTSGATPSASMEVAEVQAYSSNRQDSPRSRSRRSGHLAGN